VDRVLAGDKSLTVKDRFTAVRDEERAATVAADPVFGGPGCEVAFWS